MISIDTETTGTDLHHGNKPYIVTILDEDGDQTYWEWDVDPLTREPDVPEEDLDEIAELIALQLRVLQNPVFDVKALSNIRQSFGDDWEWGITEDTLTASHLLATNRPHDLTSLALQYLGLDVQPYEDAVKLATNRSRTIAKQRLPEWRIAAPGLVELPSVRSSSDKDFRGTEKETYWKADMWLPRAFVVNAPELLPEMEEWKTGDNPEEHPWATVTALYANSDTAVTLPLWKTLETLLDQKKLARIYRERQKLLRIVYGMEEQGITYNSERLEEIQEDYVGHVADSEENLRRIAAEYDYPLDVPKGANNDSLTKFCFGHEPEFKGNGKTSCRVCAKLLAKTERGLEKWTKKDEFWYCSEKCLWKSNPGRWLELPAVVWSRKTGKPSTNKTAMQMYEFTLEGAQKDFIDNLRVKRKLGKSLEYIQSYKKFKRPVIEFRNGRKRVSDLWNVLNPSLNPCGSDTLRWSSHNPSQQVISKQLDHNGRNLRYIFGPKPGRVWYSLDYDNLELRIPAYECEEPAMLELFENPDQGPYFGSYHLLIFSILHPDKYDHNDELGLLRAKDKYKDTWYSWTKNGNFAELYGAVDRDDGRGTADVAFHVPGAQSIIAKKLTEKSKLNRKYINYARKHGHVETMPDRSVDPLRGFPIRCKRSDFGKIVETVPLNYHVQGTACWVIMRAMIEIAGLLDDWNRDTPNEYNMIMNIHDELVFDFPDRMVGGKDLNKPKILSIRRKMESIGEDIGVRLTCGLDRHLGSWSNGESL